MSYAKVYQYKKQVSYDQGVTWQDVTPEEYMPSGTPISYTATLAECETGSRKFLLTLNDSTTVSAECDYNEYITSGEVSTQYSGTAVSAIIGPCVTKIDPGAFYKCSGITDITMSDNVKTILANGFAECSSLTSITLSNSLRTIDPISFANCSSLTSIAIPDSVAWIGWGAFRGCSGLTSINIPSGVTSIADETFYNCTSLTSVTMPNSITSIGDEAFRNCSGLTSINIPSGVTSIGDWAFIFCSGLTSITIPSGVTSIGDRAFLDCSSLTSITVNAATPPTLEWDVFDDTNNCPIYVPCDSVSAYQTASGWTEYWSRITCSGQTKYSLTLNDSTIVDANCDSTSAITSGDVSTQFSGTVVSAFIGSCVNTIDGYAFANCSGLTSIVIPNNATTINRRAFQNCSGLTNVTIGDGITEIGYGAFNGCTSLTGITCLAITPPTLGGSAFSNTNNCPIYVPANSVSLYQSAWSSYSSRIQAIP